MADKPHRTSASPVNGIDEPETPDIDGIKALGLRFGRTGKSLIISQNNDPFYIRPAEQLTAEWFAELWERLAINRGSHLRRIHYRLVSTVSPILCPDGRP